MANQKSSSNMSSSIHLSLPSIEEKKFLFAFGTDINEGTSIPSEQDDQKTPTKSEKVSISSLKIFDITSVLDTNNESQPELYLKMRQLVLYYY